MAGLVLTDASPLIGLARVNGLPWLGALFDRVYMPIEVRNEVLAGRSSPDHIAILAAEASGWLQTLQPTPTIPELPELDEGEAACIRLALAQKKATLLLMDDRAGRAIAMECGLRVAGTAAVIGMAKNRQLISSAREAFTRLHASDLRISAQVIETVLREVGE